MKMENLENQSVSKKTLDFPLSFELYIAMVGVMAASE